MEPNTLRDPKEPEMTLRDYFACKFMESVVSNPSLDLFTYEELSSDAYKMADAMLKERVK